MGTASSSSGDAMGPDLGRRPCQGNGTAGEGGVMPEPRADDGEVRSPESLHRRRDGVAIVRRAMAGDGLHRPWPRATPSWLIECCAAARRGRVQWVPRPGLLALGGWVARDLPACFDGVERPSLLGTIGVGEECGRLRLRYRTLFPFVIGISVSRPRYPLCFATSAVSPKPSDQVNTLWQSCVAPVQ